ncbi:MAG TPA: glycosyltransferase family 4 protein [Gaiellaceae bacterium]|nr:glycosyltransferase family 4 protein [Gaiellaceae bacterium]
MKVAYYSPLPPSRSGIADYSALLLPPLAERVEVVVARPGRFRREPRADVALYHVGNDPAEHGWIVEALRRRPGIVVLHEFVLHHLVSGITLARGDVDGYLAALERDAGLVGRLLGHAVVDDRIKPLWETRPQDFPLAREVLDHATGLVVHSRYVEERARGAGFAGPIRRIPMPAWPVPDLAPADVPGEPLIGCFGHINESKRVAQLVTAFALLRARVEGARLLLVGSWSPRLPLIALPEGVIRKDYVPEDELWALLRACDAVVSLRFPTMGETSAAAVRALSVGKPLVVSDVGAFRELPDEVALKVPIGDGEVEALADALGRAASSREMGAAALRLARTEHDLERVADLYAAALRAAVQTEVAA